VREKIKISIIILSFNDIRVLEAIKSVQAFNDNNEVAIIVIDGGSEDELVKEINSMLSKEDLLISEKDNGIFDGLNKGLNYSKGDYIGWLGSDDFFSSQFKASKLLRDFEDNEILIYCCAHFENNKVKRVTPSWPSRYRLNFLGLNNAHFSTFGKRDLLNSTKFSNNGNADIDYFLDIFSRVKRFKALNEISTFQSLGGYSTSSLIFILKNNLSLISVYRIYTNFFLSLLAPFIKITFKVYLSIKSYLFPVDIEKHKRF